jgi:hypothetical protein
MVKVPWCIANTCVIPRHTAKECEVKKCRHLVYMCETDVNDMTAQMGGA